MRKQCAINQKKRSIEENHKKSIIGRKKKKSSMQKKRMENDSMHHNRGVLDMRGEVFLEVDGHFANFVMPLSVGISNVCTIVDVVG